MNNDTQDVIKACKRHVLSFAKLHDKTYQFPPHLRKLATTLMEVERGLKKRVIVTIPPRHGKQISDNTDILTIDGWKKHGDLQIGDYVFHPSGEAIEVLGISSKTPSDYVVEFSDGVEIRCHENHEWTVYSRPRKQWITVETKFFLDGRKLTSGDIGKRGGRYQYQIENVKPLEFSYKDLPLDPYFLGAWLGDGKSSDAAMCYHPSDDEPIKEINKRGIDCSWESTHKTTGVNYVGFGNQGIRGQLGALSLLNNKHIPDIYKYSSIEQRLDLLSGLIDTDGHVERKTGRVRIATASEKLANDIIELLYTLGQNPYCYKQEPCTSTSGIEGKKPVYYVGFQPDIDIPTKIPRKRIEVFASRRMRAIKSVRYEPIGEVGHCIQVDSDDGLYLVGRNLIPTHNSTLCSHYFPAWYMGRNPTRNIISSTYNQDFSDDFGRKVREIMRSDAYRAVFSNIKLKEDNQSVSQLANTLGGHYFAVGVGSALTGRGASLFLIDDPTKDREDADSPRMQERLIDWYKGVALKRLEPNAAIIIIMQRWSENDLVGYVLKEHAHENWEVINMPVIDAGKPLWDRYSIEALNALEKSIGEYEWNSSYLQDPTPREGILFKPEMMTMGRDSEYSSYIISIDPAISEKETADETAIVVCGLRYGKPLQVDELETWHGHWSFTEMLAMIDMIHSAWNNPKDGQRVSSMIVEDVAFQKALVQVLSEKGYPITPIKPTKEKYLRANYITPMLNQGRIRINTKALRDQMLRFRGKSERNDMVDAFVNAITYCIDFEDGYNKPQNPYEGLTRQEIFVKRYMERFRRESEGVKNIFNEDDLNDYTNVDYY